MKRVALALALVAAVAALAPASASARHTLAHRVATLEGKVTTLRRDVRTLKTQNAALTRDLACFTGGLPAAQYVGYVYDPDGGGPEAPGYTTALDVTGPGETPRGFLALIDGACLTSGRRAMGLEDWSPLSREVAR
jgi:hypothetical protein